MPYCSIVMTEADDYKNDDLPFDSEERLRCLEKHMTIGLETVEQMSAYADKMCDSNEKWVVRILDMTVEKMSDEHQMVAMPEMPMIGRRVVSKYYLKDGERAYAL